MKGWDEIIVMGKQHLTKKNHSDTNLRNFRGSLKKSLVLWNTKHMIVYNLVFKMYLILGAWISLLF